MSAAGVDVSRRRAPEPKREASYAGSHHSAVEDSYVEDRRKRLLRGRVVGFALCVPLWVLSVVPLARELSDGGGAELALVFLAVAAATLAVAVAIRGLYVRLTGKRFWSPWLFPLAALVAIVGFAVQSAGDPNQFQFESAPGVARSYAADDRPAALQG